MTTNHTQVLCTTYIDSGNFRRLGNWKKQFILLAMTVAFMAGLSINRTETHHASLTMTCS